MAVSSRRQYEMVAGSVYKAKTKAIAEVSNLEDAKLYISDIERQYTILINTLCETFAKDNPAFNDKRFREECGYAG